MRLHIHAALRGFLLAGLGFALVACAGKTDRGAITDASRPGGSYKVGQPYQIKGSWYYPQEDYSYDETGIASWYGDDFHGLKTANGEQYNKGELTAAHKTLPLPTLARVTNLDNGRSVVVRINDRGPFSGARLIDVSQRTAQLLGFEKQGTAKVRVQVLADESRAIADALRRYGRPEKPVMLASSDAGAPESLTPAPSSGSVTSEALPPPPTNRAEARAMMASIKPVQEVRQLPVTGANQIYVQAGAFTRVENATRLQQNLARLGKVAVSNAQVNGVQYYRVRVGPVPDVASADALLGKVMKSGADAARIIVD